MKKFVSFILSFTLLSGIIGGKLFMSGATAVAEDIEEEELEPDFLISEICASSRINVTEADDSSFTAFYITTEDYLPTIENGSDSAEVRIDIEVSYDYAGDTELTLTHEDSEYFERLTAYPEFDADNKTITGNVDLFNDCGELEQINIFEYNEDGEDEDIEDGDWENDGIDTQALALSALFSRVALKIVTVAVVAVVAAIVRTYPTYANYEIGSLGDQFDNPFSRRLGSIKYTFGTLKDSMKDWIEKTRKNFDKCIYFIAIPICKDNQHLYKSAIKDDMLITDTPVSKTVAVKALLNGYSIYTLYPHNAKSAMRKAWPTDKLAFDNRHKDNYFRHYHAYYKDGIFIQKRMGIIDGIEISIHGFFGWMA